MCKELYNPEIKERFISNYPKVTQTNIRYVFMKTKDTEEKLNKDLYEFSVDELKILFYALEAKSLLSIEMKVSVIKQYIDWCIAEGYLITGINNAKIFKSENLKQFIKKIAVDTKYLTREELEYLVDKFCVNAQDAVIFELLFQGVKGEQLAEIINLKIDDVDFENNKLTLTDLNGTQRTIQVPDRTLRVIQNAIDQEEYYKKNGDPSPFVKVETVNIYKNEYVVRTSRKKETQINFQVLYKRIKDIAKLYDKPYITPNSIFISGLIDYAKKLKEKLSVKELIMEHYEEISKRFYNDKEKKYQVKRLIKDYL